MDKQEAVGFILRQLQNGHSQPEIVAALSSKLNAPRDVVSKFVAQTAAQYKPQPAARPATAKPPSPQPASPPSQSPRSQPANVFDFEDVFEPAPPSQASSGQPAAYFDFEAEFAPDSDFAAQFAPDPAPAPRSAAYSPAAYPAAPAAFSADSEGIPRTSFSRIPPIDEELEKIILSGLAKGRRHDDLIMSICERTGWSWDQAQRAVGLVGSKNRKKLVSRQNMIIIPLCIFLILGGLALILASFQDTMAFIEYARNRELYPLGTTSDIDNATFYSLGLGIAGVLGGAAGLFRSLQTQME